MNQNEYTRIMDRYVDQINKKELKVLTIYLQDKKIISTVLRSYGADTQKLYQNYKSNYGEIPYGVFTSQLHKANLESDAKRRYICNEVQDTVSAIKQAIRGDKSKVDVLKRYLELLREKDEQDHKPYIKAKYLLVALILMDKELASPKYEKILDVYCNASCNGVVTRIINGLCKSLGVKTSTKELLEETKRTLAEAAEMETEQEITDKDKIIEQQQFQISNYQTAVEQIQMMFDELKESVDENAQEAKQTAIRDFFVSMNSPNYGNLLDNIQTVEERLSRLRREHIQVQPEMMPLAIIFKQLQRFIKEYEIEPIETVGREFEASYQNLEHMNYQGEPFVNDHEVKNVKVQNPGWRYKDIIISLPTVIEN